MRKYGKMIIVRRLMKRGNLETDRKHGQKGEKMTIGLDLISLGGCRTTGRTIIVIITTVGEIRVTGVDL